VSNSGEIHLSVINVAISLATTVLMTARLIDYRNRWSQTPTPIR